MAGPLISFYQFRIPAPLSGISIYRIEFLRFEWVLGYGPSKEEQKTEGLAYLI
jgi:hypothetical protein